MADREGQQLGNYRLSRLLGKGGFAEVYLGVHLYLGTEAAIKLLHTQLASESDVEKFRREASTIARLVHPNIVRVLDFGVSDGTPYLVMDYAPNGSLRQTLPPGTPLAPQSIIPYVKQVADALQYAHDQRLIHRDVKPENMLLGRNHEVLLSDFGIATVSQTSSQQSTQAVAGTAAYMAPEQLQGHPRPASDQYALGIVVYEWLTGERPFQGSFTEIASQHVLRPPPPLRQKVPTLSPALEQVVLAALAKDPKERFPSIRAFAEAFEQASRAVDSVYSAYTRPVAPPSPDARSPGEQLSRPGPQPSIFDAATQLTPAPNLATPPTATPSGGPGAPLHATATPPTASPPGAAIPSAHLPSGGWGNAGRAIPTPPGASADWNDPTSGYTYAQGGAGRYGGWGAAPAGPTPPPLETGTLFSPPPRNPPPAPLPGPSNRRRVVLIAAIAAALLIVLLSGSLLAYGATTGNGPFAFIHSGSAANPAPTASATPGSTAPTAPGATPTDTATPTATATFTPTPTATPAPPVFSLVGRFNTVGVPQGTTRSVTASCQSGEQMVSGGYYVKDTNLLYNAESSYPSGTNAWTASITNNTPQAMTLYAYVNCLQANFPVGIQIVHNTVSVPQSTTQTATVACPYGAVLTGGGFKTSPANAGFVVGSTPGSSPPGWGIATRASFANMTETVYALCATANLAPAGINTRGFTVPASSAGQNSVGCSSDQLLTGGGYSNANPAGDANNLYYLDGPAKDFSAWFAYVYNRDSTSAHDAVVWAVCVTVTA